MSADEYVPSDDDVRSVWVVHERDCGWAPHPGDPSAEFDRFLARVRRDAAREALDVLALDFDGWGREMHTDEVARRIRHERDTHYPEETP